MPTAQLIASALILGALFSVGAAGTRGWHFLPGFILFSGLVLGVGMLVNAAGRKLSALRDHNRH
jgi:thiosulfate reductase cytochrome b subunit